LSVVGSLEDLSFPDILQVIHVSRQSGTLILQSPDAERKVRFRNGLVCGATLGKGGPELEDLLVQKGIVDGAVLEASRARQTLTGEPLPSVLIGLGAVSQETIDRVVREELRSILRSLVLLQEGEFRFEVHDEPPARGPGWNLEEGLQPDSILQGLEVPAPARPSVERRAPRPKVPRHVLLVVDRSVVRLALRDELVRRHFQVEECTTPAAGLEVAKSLTARGVRFALVCDLILPEATGEGWRGGLALLRQIRGLAPDLVAIMVGEVRDPAAIREARQAGAIGYVPLPDLGTAGLAEVGTRLSQFCGEVRAALWQPDRLAADESPAPTGSLRAVDQLSLLRGLIREMHPDEEIEIPLLVLRLAAEYFERGILFSVREGEARGTGAFGGEASAGGGEGLDDRIRGVALPVTPGSVLHRAVEARTTYLGPIPPSRANAILLERLGTPAPTEAALMPLVGGRQVFGILYGDNAPSGRPVADLRALEIFVSQAGIALENAWLQRRINSLAAGGGGRGRGARS
jgi:CheY-like chemotaxis protein